MAENVQKKGKVKWQRETKFNVVCSQTLDDGKFHSKPRCTEAEVIQHICYSFHFILEKPQHYFVKKERNFLLEHSILFCTFRTKQCCRYIEIPSTTTATPTLP
jgi:hypothetical protein